MKQMADKKLPVRIEIIDYLKGYAILLVMLGHTIQSSYIDFDNNHVFRFIYSFHMPLFMFLSGYVISLPPLNSLKKIFVRLIVPFIFWGLFSYLLKLGEWNHNRDFVFLFTHPDNGLWFLYILYLINFWYVISFIVFKINKYIGVFVCLLLFLIFSRYGLFEVYFKYFILGVICNYLYVHDKIPKNHSLVIMLLAFAFILLIPLWHRIYVVPLILHYHVGLLYNFIVAVGGIAFSYKLVSIVVKVNVVKDCLNFFGRNTLEFYAVHQYLFIIFSVIVIKFVVIKFILVIMISYALIRLININKYLKLLCFGVRYK